MNKRISLFFFILALGSQHWGWSQDSVSEQDYFAEGVKHFYSSIDSAIYFFEQGLVNYPLTDSWEKFVNCHNALTSAYGNTGNLNRSYHHAVEAYSAANKHLPKSGIAFSSSLTNLAFFARRKGDFEKAISLNQTALTLEKEVGKNDDISIVLGNLGICYFSIGDYSESNRYYKEAIAYVLQKKEFQNLGLARLYSRLAKNYEIEGLLDTAIDLHIKSIQLIKENKEKSKAFTRAHLIISHNSLASIYFKKRNKSQFDRYVNAAFKLGKEKDFINNTQSFYLKANWYFREKKYKQALKHYSLALQLGKSSYADLGKNPEIGRSYLEIAKCHAALGNRTQSLATLQLALHQYTKDFNSPDILLNPKAEELAIDQYLLKILNSKGNQLFEEYQDNNKLKFLDASNQTFELAVALLNTLRKSYLGQSSKELLAEHTQPIFEGAIRSGMAKYALNKDQEAFDYVFQLAENSRAMLLLESINEISALGLSGIPDSLQEQETALKRDIAYYEKQLRQTESTAEKKIRTLNSDLFELQETYRAFVNTLENKYPKYYQLKYDSQLATSSDVKNKLTNSNQAFIEYFVGDSSITFFCISHDKSWIKQVDKSENFEQLTENIRNTLIHPPNTKSAQTDHQYFVEGAHSLYQQIMAPLELPNNINALVVVQDDILSYIPFEILLASPTPDSAIDYSLEHLDYLLEKYQIAYNYSATLFCRPIITTKNFKKDFIGFAPKFAQSNKQDIVIRESNCTLETLWALDCTEAEVNDNAALLGGQALIGEAANKAQFINLVSDYRIAHFATHSCLDDEDPMNNKIFLSDGYISNYDLYNLQLDNELAVLSACQTGSGKLQGGEGVISLARGFIHAGCPSVLMSLWSVEDCSTSAIMSNYYQALKAGQSKDLAVRSAKLEFLQTANKLKSHPFYWAPFVQIGDLSPMQFQQTNWWLWGAGACLVFGLLWWIAKRNN